MTFLEVYGGAVELDSNSWLGGFASDLMYDITITKVNAN